MKRCLLLLAFGLVCLVAACGSDSEDDESSGAGGGSGGKQGTTCMDGYPNVGTQCAVPFEKCTSCPLGFACCDIFECENGAWVKTQSSLACPAEAGVDAELDGSAQDASDTGTMEAGD